MTLAERSSRPRADVELRLALTEDALVKGRSRSAIIRMLTTKFGMSDRHARRHLQVVHMRWLREATAEDRETARARLRAMARHTYESALARKRAVAVLAGEGKQTLEHVADPDFAGAVRALEVAAKLDGVLQGATVTVNNSTLNVLGDDAIANLRTLYFGAEPVPAQIVDATPTPRAKDGS